MLPFIDKNNTRRFWWNLENDYIPQVYKALDPAELQIIADWYKDTQENSLIGECGVPLVSFITSFVSGSGIKRIVQLGHYAGYSLLLLGFTLRSMGYKNSLFSIDIDESVTKYTNDWIKKADLDGVAKAVVSNSSDPKMPNDAVTYLSGKPQLIIIDSSHQYQHTLEELNLWSEYLEEGGFIIMHDSSTLAESFDSTKQGGVKKAFEEWTQDKDEYTFMNINGSVSPADKFNDRRFPIYSDGCGLGLIQKKYRIS